MLLLRAERKSLTRPRRLPTSRSLDYCVSPRFLLAAELGAGFFFFFSCLFVYGAGIPKARYARGSTRLLGKSPRCLCKSPGDKVRMGRDVHPSLPPVRMCSVRLGAVRRRAPAEVKKRKEARGRPTGRACGTELWHTTPQYCGRFAYCCDLPRNLPTHKTSESGTRETATGSAEDRFSWRTAILT